MSLDKSDGGIMTSLRSLFVLGNLDERGEKGFTLIEMLAATAITGILATVLVTMVAQINEAAVAQQAQLDMMINLAVAGEEFSKAFRGISRRHSLMSSSTSGDLDFVGVDGDGGFEYQDLTDNRPGDPGNQDHVHFHMLYQNGQLRNHIGTSNTHSASERTTMHFYLHDGSNFNPLRGLWGLMRRPRRHRNDSTGVTESVNTDITSMSGASIVSHKVDRLSFRFYDSTGGASNNGTWCNSWDSRDSGECAGGFPSAVEFAFRGYDPNGNVTPEWYHSTVAMEIKER